MYEKRSKSAKLRKRSTGGQFLSREQASKQIKREAKISAKFFQESYQSSRDWYGGEDAILEQDFPIPDIVMDISQMIERWNDFKFNRQNSSEKEELIRALNPSDGNNLI